MKFWSFCIVTGFAQTVFYKNSRILMKPQRKIKKWSHLCVWDMWYSASLFETFYKKGTHI